MIKVLLIEDEIPARQKLKRFIGELNMDIEIVKEIDTVNAAVEFLSNNSVDLIFSDIELLDGSAFEIYQQTVISCPIIFTTAYDQFWMEAFDSNGIAYLLKPYSKERFQKAWDKYIMLRGLSTDTDNTINNLTKLIAQNFQVKPYKRRFTVHTTQGMYFIETGDILFFEANDGIILAYDKEGNQHLLHEATLKEIEEQTNPADFFRINRSQLVHKPYILKIERYTKNTLAIKLKNHEKYLITSQSNTAIFRDWIEK